MAIVTSRPAAGDVVEIEDSVRLLLDPSGVHCVEQFALRVRRAAAERNLAVRRMVVQRWQSVEDPEWVEAVIRVTVASEPRVALDFGAEAGEMLEEIKERDGSPRTGELLFVRFDWE